PDLDAVGRVWYPVGVHIGFKDGNSVCEDLPNPQFGLELLPRESLLIGLFDGLPLFLTGLGWAAQAGREQIESRLVEFEVFEVAPARGPCREHQREGFTSVLEETHR